MLLAGSLWVVTQNQQQLENITTRRRLGQIMLSTSDKLALSKLVLQSDLPDKTGTINQLLDDIFLMQTAVNTSLQIEDQPEILVSLGDLQLDLPAISLLLQGLQTQLATGGELTRDDTLQLDQFDGIVSNVESLVQDYEQHLRAESERIEQASEVYTFISIAVLILVVAAIGLVFYFNVLRPIDALTRSAEDISKGNYEHQTHISSKDEFGQLGGAFNVMASRLRELIGTLEQRVATRTRALVTSTEVSRRLSTILDPDVLVREVVEQLVTAFDYYYAHIYIFDEAKETLIMKGGTGEAGQTMLERGHTISKGTGMVGRAAESNQVVLAPDTSQEEGWLANELLPDTRSEIAVPIAIGNDVLGVFDVQHNVVDGLTDEDADLMQSIANQVAIALQNSRSFEESQDRAGELAVLNEMARELSAETNLESIADTAYRYITNLVDTKNFFIATFDELTDIIHNPLSIENGKRITIPDRKPGNGLTEYVLNSKEPLFLPNNVMENAQALGIEVSLLGNEEPPLSWLGVPLVVGNQSIGVIAVQSLDTPDHYTEHDIELMSTIGSQVATALQNERSFSETQQRAERETALNLISQKIQNAATIEEALQTTARELGHALGKRQTLVALDPAALAGDGKGTINE